MLTQGSDAGSLPRANQRAGRFCFGPWRREITRHMQGYRRTRDAQTTVGRDDAKRMGKGAIALLAFGAPFVAAAPATADGGGPPQSGETHGQAQASAGA